jgi:hypothetical protein
MFTIGGAGALLYLLLEPEPLWRSRQQTLQADRPIGGGRGLLWAFGLAIAVAALGQVITGVLD